MSFNLNKKLKATKDLKRRVEGKPPESHYIPPDIQGKMNDPWTNVAKKLMTKKPGATRNSIKNLQNLNIVSKHINEYTKNQLKQQRDILRKLYSKNTGKLFNTRLPLPLNIPRSIAPGTGQLLEPEPEPEPEQTGMGKRKKKKKFTKKKRGGAKRKREKSKSIDSIPSEPDLDSITKKKRNDAAKYIQGIIRARLKADKKRKFTKRRFGTHKRPTTHRESNRRFLDHQKYLSRIGDLDEYRANMRQHYFPKRRINRHINPEYDYYGDMDDYDSNRLRNRQLEISINDLYDELFE